MTASPKEQLATLAQDLSTRLGTPPVEALITAARQALVSLQAEALNDQTPTIVLDHGRQLWETQGSFTITELIMSIHPDRVLTEVHTLKVQAGRILRNNGFSSKQTYRHGFRPILWSKNV